MICGLNPQFTGLNWKYSSFILSILFYTVITLLLHKAVRMLHAHNTHTIFTVTTLPGTIWAEVWRNWLYFIQYKHREEVFFFSQSELIQALSVTSVKQQLKQLWI